MNDDHSKSFTCPCNHTGFPLAQRSSIDVSTDRLTHIDRTIKLLPKTLGCRVVVKRNYESGAFRIEVQAFCAPQISASAAVLKSVISCDPVELTDSIRSMCEVGRYALLVPADLRALERETETIIMPSAEGLAIFGSLKNRRTAYFRLLSLSLNQEYELLSEPDVMFFTRLCVESLSSPPPPGCLPPISGPSDYKEEILDKKFPCSGVQLADTTVVLGSQADRESAKNSDSPTSEKPDMEIPSADLPLYELIMDVPSYFHKTALLEWIESAAGCSVEVICRDKLRLRSCLKSSIVEGTRLLKSLQNESIRFDLELPTELSLNIWRDLKCEGGPVLQSDVELELNSGDQQRLSV